MGPVAVRKLADARTIALGYRSQILAGLDPLDERDATRLANTNARAKQVTFEQAATDCIKAKSPEWKNAKHCSQWTNTLAEYAYPTLGKVPIHLLTTEAIYEALKPIWLEKTETATRVRQRIEVVWDWAKARGYCSGENPARLKGGLGELLPKSQKVKRVKHHAALPFKQIHEFIKALRTHRGVGPMAFEFMVLTATRTGEVVRAKWDEIDLTTKVWTIPGERMKAGKEHRVPLSTRAVEILKVMKKGQINDYIFSSHSKSTSTHISTGVFLAIIKKMEPYKQYTPHGFRSTFRDWAAETTSFANETLELALAHVITNQTEASYRRQDQLPKRVLLMQRWCDFIESSARGVVIPHQKTKVV
ncbi:XerC Integrase [Burkholderiales bacterium]